MPFAHIRRMLVARGYWEQAGDGTSGSSGGGAAGGAAGGAGGGDGGTGGGKGDDGKGGDGNGGKPAGGTLSDTEAKLLQEVMERKQKNKELMQRLDEATTRLKAFDGLDPDAIKALLTAEEQRKLKKMEEEKDFEGIKKQMTEAHEAALSKLQKELEDLRKASADRDAQSARQRVEVAFGDSRYIAAELHLTPSKTRALFGSHFEFDGEQVVGYDKPAGAANRVMLVDGKGNPLSFDQALAKLVDSDPDRDTLKKSNAKPGAGSKTEGRGKPEDKPELHGRSRIAAALKAAKK